MHLPVCGSTVGYYHLDAGGEDGMEETELLAERMEWRKNRVRGNRRTEEQRVQEVTGENRERKTEG